MIGYRLHRFYLIIIVSTGLFLNSCQKDPVAVSTSMLATDDNVSGVDGFTGAKGVVNVFTNDKLNGSAVNPSEVTLTESVADPSGYLTLNPDGTVDVATSTPGGTYSLTYRVCEASNPANYDEAIVTVTINYKYYISNEYKFPVTTKEIKTLLLIAQQKIPEISTLVAKVKTDIEVQKLTYKTTFKNKDIQASGLVYMPKVAGNYPILCFQNGTNTLHSEAPSENPNSDMLYMLESVASMGFIVVIPDYIGFGASSQLPHPYLHAESTTQSILDMLRAAKEFSSDNKIVAKPTKDLFIFGYSQGGWATMQLQKSIETNYASEFNLIASSCASGPYSIEFMNEYISSKTDYPMPYFLTYLLNAYHSIGLFTNSLSDFIQEPYASKIPGLFDGLHSGGTINAELTTKMSTLFTSEYVSQFKTNHKFSEIKSAFASNSVAAWNISTQTRLYHGGNDELIPVSMSQKILQDLKTAGTSDSKIQLIIIPGVGHTDGVVPVGVSTISWFMGLKK